MEQICPRVGHFPFGFLLLLLVSVNIHAQRQFGTLNVDSLTNPYPGYFLFAPNSADSLGLMDHSGQVVIRFPVGPHANPRSDVRGQISHFAVLRGVSGLVYGYVIRDSNGEPIDTTYPLGQVQADFHEGRVWSDTSYLVLSQRWVPADLSELRPGGNPDALLVEGVIQEISKDGRLVFEWSSLEHVPPTATMRDTDFGLDVVDYIHINSVEKDTDGNLLLSCRHLDAVLKIDRQTGKIIWALGGSESVINEFTFIDDSTETFRGFSHQHSAFRTSRGTLMLFDNGNLKREPQRTRIVEYELDEQAKTAKRVWEYIPEPAIFTTTMGSVTELPDGHILIGYGSRITDETSPGRVLEEIDRQGNVFARMSFLAAPRITPYRVSKVLFGMTGLHRVINGPTRIGHSVGDSTTNLEIDITSSPSSGSIVIEKHHYAPHEPGIAGAAACVIAPYRWIIRSDVSSGMMGSIKLLGSDLTFVDTDDPWVIYWRPVEGKGPMVPVESVKYDAKDSTWTLPRLAVGEYTLATSACVIPQPLDPSDGVVVPTPQPMLVFSSASGSEEYEVQVASEADFSDVVYTRVTTDTQIVVTEGVPQGIPLQWRVRRLRDNRPGQWSATAAFSVLPTRPVLISPVSKEDTVGVVSGEELRWRSFDRATGYLVTLRTLEDSVIIADSAISDTALKTPPTMATSRAYRWWVRAVTDTGLTQPSTAFFGTLPPSAWIVYPEPSVHLDRTRPVTVLMRPVVGVDSAEVVVSLARGGVIGTFPLSGRRRDITGLPAEQDLLVVIQVKGRYGWRSSAPRKIRLVRNVDLAKPEIVQPLDGDFVPVGAMATFEWQPVDGAASYHLQATDWVAFDRLTLDTVVTTTVITKKLAADAPFLQWRVQPRSDRGIGPWSDTSYVNLRGSQLLPLVPVIPKFGSRAVPANVPVNVRNMTELPRTLVEVGTDPYLDDGYRQTMLNDSTGLLAGLPGGTRHYWRPVAFSADFGRRTGPTSTFITDGTVSVSGREPNSDNIAVRYDPLACALVVTGLAGSNWTASVYSLDGRLLMTSPLSDAECAVVLGTIRTLPQILVVCLSSGAGAGSVRRTIMTW